MNILELLKIGEVVFAEDAVESKKMQTLVATINSNFAQMAQAIVNFDEYANSQLNGEVNHKIVMAKSLINYYPAWQGLKLACDEVAKEEGKKIAEYTATKTTLINNLKALMQAVAKEPAVSNYDLFEGDYKKCKEGHEVIILGQHNTGIIEDMISNFEAELVVSGHYEEVEAKELTANYINVTQNVDMCTIQANSIYANKPNKVQKILASVATMQEIGQKVVFFETYVKDMVIVGVKDKDIANVRKNFEKQYIPLKKSLQKELKVNFVEICDIATDEGSYGDADLEQTHTFQEYQEPAAEPVVEEQTEVAPQPTETVDIDDVEA